MKYIKCCFLAFALFLINVHSVFGECSTEEMNKLNSLAVNVNVDKEEMIGVLDKGEYSPPDGLTKEEAENYVATYSFFRIYIRNITEDLYIKVYNHVTEETNTYTYQDSEDGTIYFDRKYIRNFGEYTITIYSLDKTGCADIKLRSIPVTTPWFNEYSTLNLCSGAEEFYLCHRFLTVENVDFSKFTELVTKYKNGKVNKEGEEIEETPEKKKDSWEEFYKKYKVLIISGLIVLVIGGVSTSFVIKKNRSKKNAKE